MDPKVISSSTPMFTLSPASVRTTTPTASSLTPPFSFFSSTNQFLLRSQIQRKLSRSSPIYCSSTVRKSTIITCGAITDIDESQFSSTVLKSDRPVLVEFVADWCGPCRLISPSIEWVAQEYGDRLMVVKIDHDANPGLIEEYKVYGLPTLILFKNGQEVPESRREGAITKVKLKEYIDTLLDSISIA